jgi:hypothetical protein
VQAAARTVQQDTLIASLLQGHPELFGEVLDPAKGRRVQVLLTEIDRKKNGKPRFREHSFRVSDDTYYYPASTIKLPLALLALQRLNELNIPGLNMNTTMITGDVPGTRMTRVESDSTAPDGRPTIAHYIKKILLVSDNDASNRLYEFLGQEYIHEKLHAMGYADVQILHRLQIGLPDPENRHTNPVKFLDANGRVIYEQPAVVSRMHYAERNDQLGTGFMRGDSLISAPFDFSRKNRMGLTTLHRIVRSVLFPASVPRNQRFNLRAEDYSFIRRYMSMMPYESDWPRYDTSAYWDTYVKFLYYGSERGTADTSIRLFNKVGDAYGFLIDGAYIADFRTGTEYLLSAVILCNSDGIFNDDRYDYDPVGFPFFKYLGQVVHAYERSRKKTRQPDLSDFRYLYRRTE